MLALCGNPPPMQRETERDTERNLSNDNRLSRRNRPIRHQESGGKSCGTDTANYGRKAPTQWTSRSCITPEIAEQLHQNALSPSTRRRKLLAWSYGENESSPWTPVCILTSVLMNTSQLAQRNPGQPGKHSTDYVHRLAGQE